MSYEGIRWSDQDRDRHRNTKNRALTHEEPKVSKTLTLPQSVVERVEALQEAHRKQFGIGLSFSAALASIVKQAPAFKIVV